MSKVFFDVAISLNGYIAGPNGGPSTPLGEGGPELHAWVYPTRAFRTHLQLPTEGEDGVDNDVMAETISRIGANVMGKNMFVEGEANWPEVAPFHNDVFVLQHAPREPWVRPGGTTFHFVNDGIDSALQQARDSAGAKDVRISGGAETIRQYLHAGLVDEFVLHFAPVVLGRGVPLFAGIEPRKLRLSITETRVSPAVTHVYYAVNNR